MKICLEIKKSLVTASLLDDKGRKLDFVSWKDERNLMERLLPGIKELLEKNNLQIGDIHDFDYDIDVPESYSTYRIGKAVMETLRFVRNPLQFI